MKYKRIGKILTILGGIWVIFHTGLPAFSSSGYKFTAAPFFEYSYLKDLGSSQDILDQINEQVGGWLVGYEDIKLFQHISFFGIELRIANPGRWRKLEFVASIAISSGSANIIGKDYDKWNDLDTIPIIPGIMDTSTIPLTSVEGKVHTQVDTYLDYCVPIQVGIHYEFGSGYGPFNSFCQITGGLFLMKGGMDVNIDMHGTVDSVGYNITSDARYSGNVVLQDTGWVINLMIGFRHAWRDKLSSSVSVGYGMGRVTDKVDVKGSLTGYVDTTTYGFNHTVPFNTPTSSTENTELEIDGWRLHCNVIEWSL